MERDRECRLLLNDLNDILSEQCLEQRVRCRYLNDPVQELAECINQLLDICERAVTMTLDIENDYRTMGGTAEQYLIIEEVLGGKFSSSISFWNEKS